MRHNVAKVITFDLYIEEVCMDRHHIVEKEINELEEMGMIPKRKRIINDSLRASVRSLPCVISQGCYGPVDCEHITTRGAGGNDVQSNLMPLCRKHHQEKGNCGYGFMIRNYPRYRAWLEVNQRYDILERAKRTMTPMVESSGQELVS